MSTGRDAFCQQEPRPAAKKYTTTHILPLDTKSRSMRHSSTTTRSENVSYRKRQSETFFGDENFNNCSWPCETHVSTNRITCSSRQLAMPCAFCVITGTYLPCINEKLVKKLTKLNKSRPKPWAIYSHVSTTTVGLSPMHPVHDRLLLQPCWRTSPNPAIANNCFEWSRKK